MNGHNTTLLAIYKIANSINLKNSGESNGPDTSIFILLKALAVDRNEIADTFSLQQTDFWWINKWKRDVL